MFDFSSDYRSHPQLLCPKGIKRGPCGDTLDGLCGTNCNERCVWVDYLQQINEVMQQPDVRPARQGWYATLQQLMARGRFVQMCEIHAPQADHLDDFLKQARKLEPWFDAMTVTGQLKGRPVIPSAKAAGHLKAIGIETVAVVSGWDCDEDELWKTLATLACDDVTSVVCLSGDGGNAAQGQVQLDSQTMLELAANQASARRPWLGAVINPYSMPANVPVMRLKQKIAAGADFVLTQLVFDLPAFRTFMARVVGEQLDHRVHMVVGVPLVVNERGLHIAANLPGVRLPGAVIDRYRQAADMAAFGVTMARQTIDALRLMPGVVGVQVMLLGSDDERHLIDAVR